jgi:hypothetical protein
MLKAADPWYVHAILYAVITILVILLIKVAILDPKEIVAVEKYNKSESRLRMDNLKEAEILWEKKFGNFTDDLDGLVQFIKQDPFVDSVVNAFDSLTMKPANPFDPLTHGEFIPDSLMRTPRSGALYILQIDTSISYDTTINRRGNITKIDTTVTLGTRYYLEDPDGYGSVGSVNSDALKNTASWE